MYEYVRLKLSEITIGKIISKEHRKILSELYSGKTYEERFGEERAKEIKDNLSKATDHRGEKNPNFGKATPIEVRKKISESMTGNNPSEETRQKIREKAIGRLHSEETKQQIQATHLLLNTPEVREKKSENCYRNKKCKINEVEFRSVSFAGRSLDIPIETVRSRLNSNNIRWKNWQYL